MTTREEKGIPLALRVVYASPCFVDASGSYVQLVHVCACEPTTLTINQVFKNDWCQVIKDL